jgi:alkylation response protein AidB-like acyl-CoA dehydrogenase
MTIIDDTITPAIPNPTSTDSAGSRDTSDRFVPWAGELGAAISKHSARHDRDGTFVTEAFDLLRSSGYLALPVPKELGGHGATVAEVTRAQAELGRHCASTALASSMHLHVVATNAHRWRHGQTAVEPMLKRVANEGIVVVSTGGTDGAFPSGTAVRVDDGWRVSGRKTFASQAPVGDVVSTWFPTEGPGDREVLGMGIPMSAPGLEIEETWDTLGMRGTGSHDLVFTDVFVADKQVAARRPYGELDPLLRLSYINAMTIVAGAYWGVAERAAMLALEGARAKADRASAPTMRLAGAIEAERATMRWSMLGLLQDLGPDPHDTMENLAIVMLAKRTVAERGLAVADLAMELASGPSYFRTRPLEQCWRDLRAAKYHPWTPEATLHQVGRLALGLPAEP